MTNYIHHTNNVIDRAAGPLPSSYAHTSGLHHASEAELAELGWLPVVYQNEAYDPKTHSRSSAAGVEVGDVIDGISPVVGVYTITPIDPLVIWEREMAETDALMPRWVEDLWDAIGIQNAPAVVNDSYNLKKNLRGNKPTA